MEIREFGFQEEFVNVCKRLYEGDEASVLLGRECSRWFEVEAWFNSKKSETMTVGGKGSGGEWKINEERMEIVEVFKYHGVWFDRGMKGNVHLEKTREKAEK